MLKSSAALGGEKGKKETLRKLRSVCARAYLMLITPFSGDVSHPGKPFKAEGAEKKEEGGGGRGGVKGRGIWVKWCSPLLLHLSRNIKAPVMGTQVDSELFHSRLCPRARINGTFDSAPISGGPRRCALSPGKYSINVFHPPSPSFVRLGLPLVRSALSPRPPRSHAEERRRV